MIRDNLWTPEEDELLRKHKPSQLTNKQISAAYLPHRTYHAIGARCQLLKLKKDARHVRWGALPTEVWYALQQGPGTPSELMKRHGLADHSVTFKLLKEFHKAGVIYILRWSYCTGNRRWMPVYAIGRDEMDAPKPKKAGRAREHFSKKLVALKGNPFAGLIIEAEREHTQPAEDVCP